MTAGRDRVNAYLAKGQARAEDYKSKVREHAGMTIDSRDAFDRVDDILREIEDENAEHIVDEPSEDDEDDDDCDEELYDPVRWGWVGRDGRP